MIGKLIDRLDSFFGRLHFRYLGLGALLAWVYCTWFANGIFNVGETRSAILSLWASLLASAIALFSMAFRPNKRTPLSERTVSTAGFVMAACTLSLRLAVKAPCALVALSIIGGIASSVLWVAWVSSSVKRTPRMQRGQYQRRLSCLWDAHWRCIFCRVFSRA